MCTDQYLKSITHARKMLIHANDYRATLCWIGTETLISILFFIIAEIIKIIPQFIRMNIRF